MIGVTAQQVHRYEAGTNAISASQAYSFAQVLGVSVAYFFAGADDYYRLRRFNRRHRLLLTFMRNVAEISDEEHLQVIIEVVRLLAAKGKAKRP